jgi:teichuronic acid exporter
VTAARSIRHGAGWLLGGSLAGRLVQFVVGMVLARLLAPAEFGLLVTIQVFTGLAGFLAGAGMGEALVQSREADKRAFDAVFTLYLGSCLLIYAAFFVAAPWLAKAFDEPLYGVLVRVTALSFLFRPFLTLPTVHLRREMRFPLIAQLDFLNLLVASATSLILAASGYGVWSLVFGGQVGTLVQVIALMRLSGWWPGLCLDLATARRLVGYGVKFTANDIAVYLRVEAINLLVSARLGPAAVGLFNKADSLARLPTQIVSGSVYQPLFRSLAADRDNLDRCQYLFLRAITLVSLYTLPIYLVVVLLGEPLVVVLYGENWRESGTALSVLGFMGLFFVLNNVSGAVCAAHNRLGRELEMQVTSLAISLIGAWIGSQHGVTGAALGTLPGVLVFTLRFVALALSVLRLPLSSLWQPVNAVAAPFLIMLTLSGSAMAMLPAGLALEQPAVYCCAVGAPATLAYAAVFLLRPAAAVADEAARWRRRLLPWMAR